jgi:hypothetical protein
MSAKAIYQQFEQRAALTFVQFRSREQMLVKIQPPT